MTNNNESFEDRQVFLPGNQPLNKKHLITTNDIKKRQSVVYQRPANSIDSASLNTFQQPSLRNKKSSPATLSAGFKSPKENIATRKRPAITTKKTTPIAIKSTSKVGSIDKKQSAKLDTVKKQKNSQKNSITSLNDKKKVTLSFGWPIKGKILKSFSPSHNKGIDIAVKQQQSVKATEAGTVVYGGQGLIGFGKLLIIKHNSVYLSAYANNSRLLAKEGQYIQKGQIIAEVGKAGIKRSYLHFEIRKKGKPVNPLNLLPRK
ncbi:peptidoglycan DD-metalloendopeptidase family protein [Methylobacter sp. S3L5C]|uniref:peptidoglycan DD-metalloendopeptidase family protein n=1 Tax=Methylobacter sp. S3L5C TaxID=2839024 RepID=UPI001FAC5E75|nr:peptidoglycan DD-metalloendopeptidase family protein [Methylobacter sp. S3L5C]UOA10577.1 peptidoglycan DD-metalloendopeptidase family protein [Methylobacter sp. S3L5C]